MANKRFSDFDLKSPILNTDYLVGFKQNGYLGPAEFKATFEELQNSLPNEFKYLGLDIKAGLQALSGNWQDTYVWVASASPAWSSTYSSVYELSSKWLDAYTTYSQNSATYLTSETDSQTLSFDEVSKLLTITNGNTVSLSSLTDYETSFAQSSANYESTYSTVATNSAIWLDGGTAVDLLLRSIVRGLSGQLISVFSTVQASSAVSWNVSALSGAWQSTYTTVANTSADKWINLHDVTYNELVGLKASNKLNPGQFYKITDFQLKWWNQSINDLTVKSSQVEPLIVLALSPNGIAREAFSEMYPDDVVYYDIDAATSATWGNLNTTIDIPDFKGWIYRRINKTHNLDIAWDWRNITSNCCKADTSQIPDHNPATIYNRLDVVKTPSGRLIYSTADDNTNSDLMDPTAWLPLSPFNETRTYYPTDESGPAFSTTNDMSLDVPWVQLPPLTSTRIQQPTFTSSVAIQGMLRLIKCRNVTINGGSNNVIIGTDFRDNLIGTDFNNNLINTDFQNNTIKNGFSNNVVGYMFDSNSIGDDFKRNVVRNNFQNNTIKDDLFSNNIGAFFVSNTVYNDFKYNVVGNSFFLNDLENSFYGNAIGNNFNKNEIGNGFIFNDVSNDFRRNEIHDSCLTFFNLLTSFHFYTDYHVDVFRNACNEVRLRYFNCTDQLVVTDIDTSPYAVAAITITSLPLVTVESVDGKLVVYSNSYQDVVYMLKLGMNLLRCIHQLLYLSMA